MKHFVDASRSLNAGLSPDKLSFMATSRDLARDVCESLGLPPSVCKSSVAYLGIDGPAGARRHGQRARLKQRG
eukprot:2822643-Pyramimonas_sp.AAC.1